MRTERIDSASDPRVADYRNLKDADLRGRKDAFVVEGRLGVRCLGAASRFPARSVLVTPTALTALSDDRQALASDVPVYVAEPSVLNEIVGYDLHRGCLAMAERRAEADVDGVFPTAPETGPGLALVAEQLTNPDNIGGLFRNAMAFGATGVLLCPRCTDPLYRKAVRVSMGGALEVPFARSADWPGDLERLRARGWCLVALDPREDSMELGDWVARMAPGQPVALLVGSEGPGLSPAAIASADWRVHIRMAAGVDSLNVATAAAIALHDLARAHRGARARVAS